MGSARQSLVRVVGHGRRRRSVAAGTENGATTASAAIHDRVHVVDEHPEASPTTPTAPTTSTAPTIPTSAQPSNSTVPKWISTLFPGVPVAAHRPLRTQRQEAPPLPTPSLQNVTAAFSAIFPDSVASIDPDLFEDVWQEMARLAQEDQHYITELYEGSEWSGGSARRTEKGGKKWWAGVKDWFAAAETDGWERP
ncbi:hypothetical protein HK104_009290 [Borealophlyctis nickersoniae]|nr:hypothetical protein HK104_009290 [Borealophlyctis nickersoniae]